MKAREKFNARMVELGFEPVPDGENEMPPVGTFKDGRAIVLEVQDDNGKPAFREWDYPTLEELRKNPLFVQNIMALSLENAWSSTLVEMLYQWLCRETEECPIDPLSIHFTDEDFAVTHEYFEDDKVSIMDASNAHDEAIVARINETYNTYGTAAFMVAICKLHGSTPFVELETVDPEDMERISMSQMISEILENWCDNDDLEEIIHMVEGKSTKVDDFYNKDGKLAAQLFRY